jgi:Protein of unknown function (DUF2786)
MDNGKLIALLNLTTSDNDHEALNAIRIANALIKKNNLRWENLIGITAPVAPGPKPKTYSWSSTSSAAGSSTKWPGDKAPATFDRDFVDMAYKNVAFCSWFAARGSSTAIFMASLKRHFLITGSLTTKQYEIFASIWKEYVGGKA